MHPLSCVNTIAEHGRRNTKVVKHSLSGARGRVKKIADLAETLDSGREDEL
jgi:hypothetical protein